MRFTIKLKISLAFGLFIPLIATNYWMSEQADRKAEMRLQGVMHVHEVLNMLDDLDINHREMQEGAWLYLLSHDKQHLNQYEEAVRDLPGKLNTLHKLVTDPEQVKRLAAIENLLMKRKDQVAAMLATIDKSGNTAAVKILEANLATGSGDKMLRMFKQFETEERIILKQRQEEYTAETLLREKINITIDISTMVAAFVFAAFLMRAMTRPVRQLLDEAERVGAGDFSGGNLSGGNDELGDMTRAFNRMVGQLRENLEQRRAMEEQRLAMEVRVRDTLDTTVRVVGEYQRFVADVSKGDLRQRVEIAGDSTGTLGQLGVDLNNMTESLAGVASGTTEAINTIYSALEQLQSSISSQSSGASEQAAAVNQTSASLDEIKAMAAQTMDKVQVLGEAAERSRRESEQGSAAVEQSIVGMTAIRARVEGIAQTILALSEQTQQIGEITSVVTNLAQQSKMLALNASIEAAKAGEAGKGFAVVAAEVRELAEQSQQSTAQVQKILQDIRHATDRAVMATEEGSKGVDAGMLSVQKSGEVMGQLGEVVRETAMASQQISAVVRQQFIGLEQVTQAMKEINKVTTQFVSSAQQSKDSSNDLRRVAERLRQSVSVYKL